MLTPDSSRFWPRASYAPGHGVPSFDKQFVRDYLEEIKWNKQPPVPSLPEDVVQRTREKYIEAFRLLSGRELQSEPCATNWTSSSRRCSTRASSTTTRGASSRGCSSPARSSGAKGNVGDAAELLGIHRNTVARKMAEYHIKRRPAASVQSASSDRRTAESPAVLDSPSSELELAVAYGDCLTAPPAPIDFAVAQPEC